MGRAPCCDKANVKKGPWSPEEDAKLKDYIEKYGTGGNWIALPQKIGMKRCGKSCRLRWLNYLRPNIKHGGFSEEEDNIICSLYISIGSRWSVIAAQLPGRTDNDVKNYWNTRLKKKLLGRRKQANNNGLSSGQDSNGTSNGAEDGQYSQGLSNSAIERLQLHMQLQSLQNPLSLYNNPALWAKLHRSQVNMVRNLQSLNENQKPIAQNFNVALGSQLGQEQNIDNLFGQSTVLSTFPQDYQQISNPKVNEFDNSLNAISSSDTSIPISPVPQVIGIEQSYAANQEVSTFQAELENFLNYKGIVFTPQEDQMAQFDCSNAMNGTSKDSFIWWANELESKSSSSNSWESTPAALQSEGIFHDFELGYNL